MTDLVEFLRARLDEDKAAARACPYEVWEVVGPPPEAGITGPAGEHKLCGVEPHLQRGASREWLHLGLPTMHTGRSFDHAARHDPARVLREVEAKRRTVGRAETYFDMARERPDDSFAAGMSAAYRAVLKDLALPHSDHEDYRDEWKP